MKTRSFSPMGSMHPVLFFAAIYVVALLFAIFICSSLFYSCNAGPANLGESKTITLPGEHGEQSAIATR